MRINVKDVLYADKKDVYHIYSDQFQRVIPPKYELIYDRLQSLVDEYYLLTDWIRSESYAEENQSDRKISLGNELSKKQEEYKEIVKRIKKIDELSMSDSTDSINLDDESFFKTYELLEEKEKTISKQRDILKEQFLLNKNLNENNNSFSDTIVRLSSIEKQIKVVVDNIKDCLEDLDEIKVKRTNNDGGIEEIDRFENFEVQSKHIKKIYENLNQGNLPEQINKQIRTDLIISLLSYLSLRKATTKLERKNAEDIIEAYNKRSLLYSDNRNYGIQRVANSIFYESDGFTSKLGEYLNLEVFFGYSNHSKDIDKKCDAMNVIKELVIKHNNGSINDIDLEETIVALDSIDSNKFEKCKNEIREVLYNEKQKNIKSF